MRQLVPLALGTLALLAAPLGAQCPPPATVSPLQPGEIGLFFDAAGTQKCTDVPMLQTVQVFAVARVPESGIIRFSVGDLGTEGPSEILSEAITYAAGFEHQDIADGCDEGVAPTCHLDAGDVVALAVFDVLRTGDATLCIGSFCRDTIAGPGPPGSHTPVYWSCAPGASPTPFTLGENLCLRLQDLPVAVEAAAWQLVKNLYRE